MTPTPFLTRERLQLLLVAALFLGSFGVAAALFFGGWAPSGTRNFGELLEPYPDLRELPVTRADGSAFAWQPEERRWSIIVAPAHDCGEPCVRLIDTLHRVWLAEGRHAERLQVLWVGEVPEGAPSFPAFVPMGPNPELVARLPDPVLVGQLPVYVADPAGWLVLRYPHGFDPSGLRKDLGRVIR
ncbi:hypothetical protein [Arenimonas composti]|uniref:Thioredoxin domain-containing protein n=1 Tax=Arenimonas composti TR7-09 = DSM 18010 TaxID=1121013 RepID=A0A091BZS9_9GAMM|nr:hypothetical protein [Arenimonas composti]KFN49860.1 hypothetical protein P873_09050 [Arenimonas composti TR7-09 = DSM 18010]